MMFNMPQKNKPSGFRFPFVAWALDSIAVPRGPDHHPHTQGPQNTCIGETAAAGAVLTGIPLRGLLGALWTEIFCPAPPAKKRDGNISMLFQSQTAKSSSWFVTVLVPTRVHRDASKGLHLLCSLVLWTSVELGRGEKSTKWGLVVEVGHTGYKKTHVMRHLQQEGTGKFLHKPLWLAHFPSGLNVVTGLSHLLVFVVSSSSNWELRRILVKTTRSILAVAMTPVSLYDRHNCGGREKKYIAILGRCTFGFFYLLHYCVYRHAFFS